MRAWSRAPGARRTSGADDSPNAKSHGALHPLSSSLSPCLAFVLAVCAMGGVWGLVSRFQSPQSASACPSSGEKVAAELVACKNHLASLAASTGSTSSDTARLLRDTSTGNEEREGDASAASEVEKLRERVKEIEEKYENLKRRLKAMKRRALRTERNAGFGECEATPADVDRYNDYKTGRMCPNDWFFVQRLIFKKNCFALPRRRCLAVTPANPTEPLERPAALFSPAALKDENVRWDLHDCKSYECLNARVLGDCRDCFNLTTEAERWQRPFRGTIPMDDVIKLKNGSLRIGLDVGGGTGSFAAHMALHGVTVMTTAFNVETTKRHHAGLPYMETIAQRGLIPLHWPHKARLPLFDGTLDLIHSVNSIKYLSLQEFQELIYEWNRVLRPGGVLWFEMFYAPKMVMPRYVQAIEALPYKKLYWNFSPKPEAGEVAGEHEYLNCVLEKLPSPGSQVLRGPRKEDMQGIWGGFKPVEDLED